MFVELDRTMFDDITVDELDALYKSEVCVQCGHRELVHLHHDYGEVCNIPSCDCSGFMEVGAYSPWNIDMGRWRDSVYPGGMSNSTIKKMLERVEGEMWDWMVSDVEQDVRDMLAKREGRILHVVRPQRLQLPEKELREGFWYIDGR